MHRCTPLQMPVKKKGSMITRVGATRGSRLVFFLWFTGTVGSLLIRNAAHQKGSCSASLRGQGSSEVPPRLWRKFCLDRNDLFFSIHMRQRVYLNSFFLTPSIGGRLALSITPHHRRPGRSREFQKLLLHHRSLGVNVISSVSGDAPPKGFSSSFSSLKLVAGLRALSLCMPGHRRGGGGGHGSSVGFRSGLWLG